MRLNYAIRDEVTFRWKLYEHEWGSDTKRYQMRNKKKGKNEV